ncbi:NAD(P)/FAD-dependent oxidoreductase [Halobacillus fulvus]|nr:NAD(P)/FAD-dependent oxidoreductase [Halobacillus fulvus]
MTNTYDLIVIGTGVAGGTVAQEARKKGWQVAVIDQNPYGGTCPQRGCDPKRVLAGITEIYDNANRLKNEGVNGDFYLEWEDMKPFMETFTTPVAEQVEESFKKAGIDTYHGQASFLDPHTITIDGETINGHKFVIATGAKPAPLPIDGAEHMMISDDFFELDIIPERVVFIGGGYISFEFAHLCARLAKNVTIIHRGKHVLESFDHEMTNKLIELSKDVGIDIHVQTEAQSITKTERDEYIVTVKKFDHTHEINADLVVHGAGRIPNTEGLNTEAADLDVSEKGIKVDHNFQTNVPHIYAAGDVADSGLPLLTPVAGTEANRLLSHLIDHKNNESLQTTIPSVVFTYPKLAKVGLTQQEAREQNIPYEVQSKTITSFFSYKRTKSRGAYVKILKNPLTDEIIGAHFLTDTADHLVNLFLVAIEKNMTDQELSSLLWAYPTEESDIPSFF